MQGRRLLLFIFSAIYISSAFAQAPPVGNHNGLITTDGDNPLTTSFAWEGRGNAVVKPVAFDNFPNISGTFVLSEIPGNSSIIKAYYAIAGWQVDYVEASGTFGGYNLGSIYPVIYDQDPDIYYLSFYRWDVTQLITGNSSYSFSGSDLHCGYLAYLMVIYENPSLPVVGITVNDGAESLRYSSSTTFFTGSYAGPGVLMIVTQAGDTMDEIGESIEFNDSLLAGPDSVFNSNIGDHADYHEFFLDDIQNSNSLTITTGEDWFGIHLAVLVCTKIPTVLDETTNLSTGFGIARNYPNPFNGATTINYNLRQTSDVTIEIYDIRGNRIETFTDYGLPPGNHRAAWNAKDFSSGIYFYKIQAGDHIDTGKMVLLK